MGWLDWLIVPPCCLCQRFAKRGVGCFCLDCAEQLQQQSYPAWDGVGPTSQLPVYAWGPYQGLLRRALQQLKYHRQPRVATVLGRWMGQAWNQAALAAPRSLVVVPIPLHLDRLRQRGYNQAELLSREFCATTGLAHGARILERVQVTQPQFGLSRSQRQENLQRAFQLKAYPKGGVLLLDDIYTTGATISTASEVLTAAGVQVAGVVVVARAELQSQSHDQPIQA
ncbi:MAG: ComF family protein [Synechococcaceae cyanobacterium SM2_3_1]|nr:ComF family protein [Synechococcaceae cyanobacterium SM2_3_1]